MGPEAGGSVVERMKPRHLAMAIVCVLVLVASVPAVSGTRPGSPPSILSTHVGPNVVGRWGPLGFSAYVADDRGVATVVGTVSGPLPGTTIAGTVNLDLVSGTAQNGLWNGTLFFANAAVTGNYSTAITATDASGKQATVASDPIAVDADPPVVVFPPDLFPRYVGPNSALGVRVALADNTGVVYASAMIFGPNDPTAFFAQAYMYEEYGTPTSGNWTVRYAFPSGTPEGDYNVFLNASDAFMNLIWVPAGVVTYDATPPETSILSAVDGSGHAIADGGRSKSTTMTFTFAGTDANGIAGFYCSLDAGVFYPCSSGVTYAGLSRGTHTFQVAAVDAAGNVDPTPATFTWSVKH